jgi:ADP-ribose pyrophosphatase YjhB (NUDIX family)
MEIGKKIAAGVLPICAKTGRILIIRRGLNQSNPGMWACFGGKFEEGLDKNPKDNAKREFVEESGYAGKYKISNLPLYVNKDNHSVFYTYIGVFDEEFTPNLESGDEAIDYGWFYIDETPEALLPGFKEAIEKKHKTLQNIICFYSGKC